MNMDMNELSLQDKHAPTCSCFGCGPKNDRGLQIKSFVKDDEVVATFHPEKHHEAFDNCICGGIISTLLDCHSYWCAAHRMMQVSGASRAPSTVTTGFSIKFLRPAPSNGPVLLRARALTVEAERATVESTLEAGGKICATFRGEFVTVRPGHPAYQADWR
jgi:acyl-coenzyme A thioesterase PaaI-like protein